MGGPAPHSHTHSTTARRREARPLTTNTHTSPFPPKQILFIFPHINCWRGVRILHPSAVQPSLLCYSVPTSKSIPTLASSSLGLSRIKQLGKYNFTLMCSLCCKHLTMTAKPIEPPFRITLALPPWSMSLTKYTGSVLRAASVTALRSFKATACFLG